MLVYFDSKKEACKTPFGAVSDDTCVKLTLYISRIVWAENVYLRLFDDFRKAEFSYALEWKRTENGFDAYCLTLPKLNAGLYFYEFCVDGRRVGKTGHGAEFDCGAAWQLTVFERGFETPDWIKGGLYYQIFVDRFCREGELLPKDYAVMHASWNEEVAWRPDQNGKILNNDFFGGNLEGVISKLPYLKDLGVNCIYLNPIFEAYSNHKYDTADYMKIDSMFGDEAVFAQLCKKAHALGIRIILDGVFNHVGADSVYFNRYGRYDSLGAYQSVDSKYFKWFNFQHFPDKYSSWWGFETLPDLNEREPSYVDFITGENGVIQKWLLLGADGWRLDVADELPDEFICKIRERIKLTKPDAILMGEVWEDASSKISYGVRRKYLLGRELDSVMNYPFRVAIIEFVRNGDAEQLGTAVEDICENYPLQVVSCLMNMLGTHDSDRAITALAGDALKNGSREERADKHLTDEQFIRGKTLLKLASALQMTLPGVPSIYYGDEVGMQGYTDPFCRRPFPWNSADGDLTQWFKDLGKMRSACVALKDGAFRLVCCKDGFFAFTRTSGAHKVAVAVNRDNKPRCLRFERHAKNLLTGENIPGGEYMVYPDDLIIAEVTNI